MQQDVEIMFRLIHPMTKWMLFMYRSMVMA